MVKPLTPNQLKNMNKTIGIIILGIIAIINIVCGALFCFYNKEGWGWFLGVGVITAGGMVVWGDEKEKTEKDD